MDRAAGPLKQPGALRRGQSPNPKALALVSPFHPAAYTVPGNPRRVGSGTYPSVGWQPARCGLVGAPEKAPGGRHGDTVSRRAMSRRRVPSTRGASPPPSQGLPGCRGHTGRRKGRELCSNGTGRLEVVENGTLAPGCGPWHCTQGGLARISAMIGDRSAARTGPSLSPTRPQRGAPFWPVPAWTSASTLRTWRAWRPHVRAAAPFDRSTKWTLFISPAP